MLHKIRWRRLIKSFISFLFKLNVYRKVLPNVSIWIVNLLKKAAIEEDMQFKYPVLLPSHKTVKMPSKHGLNPMITQDYRTAFQAHFNSSCHWKFVVKVAITPPHSHKALIISYILENISLNGSRKTSVGTTKKEELTCRKHI